MDALSPNMFQQRSPFSAPSNGTCPYEPTLHEYTVNPIFGDWTFYRFNLYLSGACAFSATLIMWSLQFLHATHFTRPSQQTKIIRIGHLIPTYSLINWFCIFVPKAYYYIDPWLDLVQSITLTSFFLLMCDFIAPDEDQRSHFFTIVNLENKKQTKVDTPAKRMAWYRRKWIAIFQYPIVSALIGIVTDITQSAGPYCENSLLPKFSHLWLFLINNVSVTTAVSATILMYQGLTVHLAHHRPLAKLGAFKIIVFLGTIQGIVFEILQSTNIMRPTATLSYADVKVGIPALLLCVEMVPLSIFFHYAYSYREYSPDRGLVPGPESQVAPRKQATKYQGGFLGWRALLRSTDPREALFGFYFAFQMASMLNKRRLEEKKNNGPPASHPASEQSASSS